jgi:hypothetical protein
VTYLPKDFVFSHQKQQNHSNFDGERDRVPVSGRGCCSLSPLKLCHNVAVRFIAHNLSQMTVDRSLHQTPKSLELWFMVSVAEPFMVSLVEPLVLSGVERFIPNITNIKIMKTMFRKFRMFRNFSLW